MSDEIIQGVSVDLAPVLITPEHEVFDLYLNLVGVDSGVAEALKFHVEGFLARGVRLRKIIATLAEDSE